MGGWVGGWVVGVKGPSSHAKRAHAHHVTATLAARPSPPHRLRAHPPRARSHTPARSHTHARSLARWQGYALFRHMTVRDNIKFGMRMQRLDVDMDAK